MIIAGWFGTLVSDNFLAIMKNSIILFIVLILLLGVFVPACDKQQAREAGTLEGTISIGPICPVEKDPPDPACLPTAETYKAYPVYIQPARGQQKQLVSPELDGSFKMELASGNYIITLERQQNGVGGSNLPLEVVVNPSATTMVSIDIDTGIR